MLAFRVAPPKQPWYLEWRRFVFGFIVLTIGAGVAMWLWLEGPENEELANPVVNEQPLSQWVDESPWVDSGAEPPDEDNRFLLPGQDPDLPPLPPPPPPSIERMKKEGCVADGFLSGYGGDTNSSISLVNRSECYYLHRALETWLKPPDFKLARKILDKVEGEPRVFGMFIAEAIDTKSDYDYPLENREFEFDEMCRPGSKNFWGEHTCKPSLEEGEYRKYVRYITERAMDMGIQSFLFGQVFYQDRTDLERSKMPGVIRDMREYAKERGMEIVIGAQTNDITDEGYLRLFDYIEGGVGLSADGSVEEGACHARWYEKPGDWCWALLAHPIYRTKANHVFVHFDWSGKLGDDMSVFTRMDKGKREETLRRLHEKFSEQNVGFLLPLLATLHADNGGCFGPKPRYYSASRKYGCQDEEAINAILKE